MTTDKSADDAVLDDVFSSGRDRVGNDAPADSGRARDERGRFSAKQEPAESVEQPKVEPPAATAKDAPPPPSQEQPDPNSNRHVPLSELLSERNKSKSRIEEAERRVIEAETRARLIEDQFARAARQQHQPQRQEPQPPPDPWTDPEGAFRYQQDLVQQFRRETQLQMYQTRLSLGAELLKASKPDFQQAVDAFAEIAERDPALQQKTFTHPNPAAFAYEEGRKLLTLKEIGDPAKYRDTLRETLKAELLAELKAGKHLPPPPQRFPESLADATPAGSQVAPASEESILGSVFASNRRRKG